MLSLQGLCKLPFSLFFLLFNRVYDRNLHLHVSIFTYFLKVDYFYHPGSILGIANQVFFNQSCYIPDIYSYIILRSYLIEKDPVVLLQYPQSVLSGYLILLVCSLKTHLEKCILKHIETGREFKFPVMLPHGDKHYFGLYSMCIS